MPGCAGGVGEMQVLMREVRARAPNYISDKLPGVSMALVPGLCFK